MTMTIEPTDVGVIQEALSVRCWETARRLALSLLKDDPGNFDVRLLLHEAFRGLAAFAEARNCLLEADVSDDRDQFNRALLLAEDHYHLANYNLYRNSKEAKRGLSGDEYIDKYKNLCLEELTAAEALVKEGCQREALEAMRHRCTKESFTKRKSSRIIEKLSESGTAKIKGVFCDGEGYPLADIKMVVGLEVVTHQKDPETYVEPEMHCPPEIGPQRSRETETDEKGHFCFENLPAGRHEFIAACLNPFEDAIGTHFLAHDLVLGEGEEKELNVTLDSWSSAEAQTVNSPFDSKRIFCGQACACVHEEVLRNPFHFQFPRQQISFSLPEELPADSRRLVLLGSHETDAPVSFQLEERELSFFAELAPCSDRVYALYLLGEGKDVEAEVDLPVLIDEGESAVLHTGCAEIRIAWGSAPADAPPIQGVKGEDGVWRGCGRWVLPKDIELVSRQSKIVSQGPLSLTVESKYVFSTGDVYKLCLRIEQNEPTVLVHEISPDLPGVAFEFSLSEFSGGRGFLHWSPENGSVHWSSLTAKDREIARLQESVPWWIPPAGFGYAMTADGLDQKDYIAVVTLRRGEWVDRLFAELSQGPGDDHRELDWPFPEMVGSTVSMITAHTRSDGDAYFRFGCFDGERRWGLIISNFERNDGPCKEISSLQHKHSSPRLQEFKTWHIDEQDKMDRPFILTQKGKIIGLRNKAETPAFAPIRKRVAEWETIGNEYDRFDSRGLDALLSGDPLALWSLKKEIAASVAIQSRMTLLGRDYSDTYSPVGGRCLTPWAEVFDLIVATSVFTPEEEREVRSCLMLMGHMYMQPDLMNWHFNSRNANFEADRTDVVGSIGLAFHGNPDAKGMIDHCVDLMHRSLEVYCTPGSGKWYENPACYYLHASSCRLNLAFHLWQHDLYDASSIPRMKDYLSWAMNIATAPYSCSNELLTVGADDESYTLTDKTRRIPPIGDHAHLGQWIPEFFALMGLIYRERDPEFSEKLFWLYQSGGSHGGHFSRHTLFLSVMTEDDLKPAAEPLLPSRRLEGFGTVSRSKVHSDEESYLLFKLGPGGYRYHRTEGSILLIHRGRPMIFDGGEAGETWRHTTLSFGETHMPLAPGHIERFHSCGPMDFSQGVNPKALQPGEPVFLSDSCEHTLVALAHERYHEPNPANSRSVTYVKDDYVILHDELNLPKDQLTHWHLQAVADSHTGNATKGFTFKGRFGTDLQVQLPGQHFDQETVTQQPILEYHLEPEDTFSMRHLQLTATEPDHFLAVIRPLSPGEEPVQSELLAEGKGVRIVGHGIDDLHWFSRSHMNSAVSGIRFKGRYGSILKRAEGTHFILQGEGEVEADGVCLQSNGPSVHVLLTANGESKLSGEGKGDVSFSGVMKNMTLSFNAERKTVCW